ncbi:MAG TPA: acyl-CoA acyltransferase, partial [Bradyrhizobium sp.]
MNALRPKIRCREIGEADLGGIADLLARGFYGRSRDYWLQGLHRQAARDVPQGYPRFGYMLDHEGVPVGVLLLIYSLRDSDGETAVHCNLSSWYVEPAFRNYAPMLTSLAQRRKEVSYFNISPAHWTWPIIEAQGFR